MIYVEVPSRHFVVEIGLACKILSTVRFFIVAPTQALISYIRVLSSDCGAVLYVRCWTVSSASPCSYSEHCHNYEMCFFSNSTHRTQHVTPKHGCHVSHGVIHTYQVTQDPNFFRQLLLVTWLCCSAACVGDQLYGYVINTPTGSGSWQLWDKVKVMALYKVDAEAVLPCR